MKKQQNLHFWLKFLCKKNYIFEEKYFRKTTFFNKKQLN